VFSTGLPHLAAVKATRDPEPSCLFPEDEEIARLLFGADKGCAKLFLERLPIHERQGFPRKAPEYGRRYWPAVKAYLDYEWGLIEYAPITPSDQELPPIEDVFRPVAAAAPRGARKRRT
jgi:hypothetical protein